MRKLKRQSRTLQESVSKNTTEEVQRNYRNSTESALVNTTGIVQKNYRNSTEENHPNKKYYRNTTGQTTEEKQKKYRKTTEIVQKKSCLLKDISLLTGKQKIVFIYLVERAKIYGSESMDGWRLTPPISSIDISERCSSKSVRASREVIRELMKANIIKKEQSKHGPGGWTIYGINSESYSKAVVLENYRNSTEIVQKNYRNTTGHTTDQTTEISHSSSKINNLKSTTTIENVDNFLKKHNILIPEELNNIGFGSSHLSQILKTTSLSANDIQESLNHYALDLRNGSVRAGFGKLNMIVGVLKKSNQYVSEAYITEEQNMLSELAKRAEMFNELKKKQAQIAILKKYKIWKSNLTQDEINKLVPPSNVIEEGGTLQDIQLQNYFETKHYKNGELT